MKVYDLQDKQGRVFAFEVNSSGFWFGRSGVITVVRRIPGAQIIRAPYFFGFFSEDEFCEFEVDGQHFEIWEPFGDSSRYWVGPKPPRWCEQLDVVRTAFLDYSSVRDLWQKVVRLFGRHQPRQQ